MARDETRRLLLASLVMTPYGTVIKNRWSSTTDEIKEDQ